MVRTSHKISKMTLALSLSVFTIIAFFITKTLITLGVIKYTHEIGAFEYICFLVFCVPAYFFTRSVFDSRREEKKNLEYSKSLISVLIEQSHNELFYSGDVSNGAMVLTREVATAMETDRASIWLYNEEFNAITCKQLYVREEEFFCQGSTLFEKDFPPYFLALTSDPIIVANNAETHPATSCFLESYLKPLGIKSMLDVPIWLKGRVIGVICIESFVPREWKKEEIDFVQLLSSLYSFAHSVKEAADLTQNLKEMDQFISAAALISKTDAQGKITYVNEKFTKISGWSEAEVIGQDHSLLNSGEHSRSFWAGMYKATLEDKGIWNAVVTNQTKDGSLYHVDTYIKADFNPDTGALEGFVSIRQDMTEIIQVLNELDKKNTYLEHAAKILRHDMHSGINTYIPRGISSLERRLDPKTIESLKIEAPLKMIKEGLKHTQKVYKGVYEFTNLVKKDSALTKSLCNIKAVLEEYLTSTAYKSQVILNDNLPTIEVNESLFCTALDNLIRNGLKYNDSDTKVVKVYFEKVRKRFGLAKEYIIVEDNGRGISQKDFEHLSKPYTRKKNQKESGTGLGLNICKAILTEHGFEITAEKLKERGTKLKIRIK